MPTFRRPVSTRPTGTVPAPVIEYTSWTGRRSGRFVGLGGTVSWFSAATRAGPLYHGILVDAFVMFSPLYELMGMKGILSTLKPEIFRSPLNSVFSRSEERRVGEVRGGQGA